MIVFENLQISSAEQGTSASFSTNNLHYFFPYSEKERFSSLEFDPLGEEKIRVNGKLLFPLGNFQKIYKIHFQSKNNCCFDTIFLNNRIDTASLETKIKEQNWQDALLKTLDLVFDFLKDNQAIYILIDMNDANNYRNFGIIMKAILNSDNQFFILTKDPASFNQQGAVVSSRLFANPASNFKERKRFLLRYFWVFFSSFFCLLLFCAGLAFRNEKIAYFYILIFAGLLFAIIHFVLAARLLGSSLSRKTLSLVQTRRLICSSCLTTLFGSLCAIGLCILIISHTQIFPISSFAGPIKGVSILISLMLTANCIISSFFSSPYKKKQ